MFPAYQILHAAQSQSVAIPSMISFQKSIAAELQAIERILSQSESRVKRDFLEYIRNLRSEESLRTIRQHLERGDVQAVIDYVNSLSRPMAASLAAVFAAAGAAEVSALAPKATRAALRRNGVQIPVVSLAFDPSNERAAQIIRETGARFIREINEKQTDAIRSILSQAQIDGLGPRNVAIRLRDNLGLTESQIAAVNNYERLLRAGSAQALDRDLRDRRFDGTVLRAKDKPLTEAQINRMVERYRSKYIDYRTTVVSRTEAHTAVNRARDEALRQTLEETGLPPDSAQKTWRSTLDQRTRDQHADMNGQTVGLDEPFIAPNGDRLLTPGDPSLGAGAGNIVNCRCSTSITIS